MWGIFVRCIALPWSVEAVTIPNDDNTYNVYVNSTRCQATQEKALQHEIRHIKLSHFYDDEPVIVNEKEAG